MSDTATEEARDKDYRIIVNGEHKTVESDIVTYEEAVKLAYPDPGDKIYSVTFEKAKKPHEGDLAPGQTVEIKDGTEFDVEPTGRS